MRRTATWIAAGALALGLAACGERPGATSDPSAGAGSSGAQPERQPPEPAERPTVAPPRSSDGAPAATGLAPSVEIQGLQGLRTRGEVRFAADPDDVHELDTLFVFPDRARAHMVALARPATSSWTEMRRGAELYKRDSPAVEPRRLEGAEALAVALRLERRRALYLYPAGFEWRDGPVFGRGERHARVEPLGPRAPGFLWVRLDGAGRALELGALTEAADLGSLLVEAWRPLGGREVPGQLEFRWVDASATVQPIWTETIRSLDVNVRFRDEGIFVPGSATGFRQTLEADLEIALPARAEAREALEGGSPAQWRAQLERARARAERQGTRPPDGTLRVELDASGAPAALLLLLLLDTDDGGAAPEPYRPHDARSALQRLLPDRADGGWERLDPALREELAAAVAGLRAAAAERAGAGSASAYLRLPAPDSGRSVQIVLPLGS